MLAVSESVTETIKQIIQSLQIRFLFPAIVFVMLNFFILPDEFKDVFKLDDSTLITINVILIILISYLFSAFNGLIIRLAEGYELKNNWVYSYRRKSQKRKYDNLKKRINICKEKIQYIGEVEGDLECRGLLTPRRQQRINDIRKRWRAKKNSLMVEKNFHFSEWCFPTNIGNTIAAFEHYPKIRYGMDAVYLWSRMLPILEDKKFLPLIQNEKSTLDLLLNNGFICIVTSFELLFLLCYQPNLYYLIFLIFSFFCSLVFYYAANFVAKDWGIMVCTAFDLYREDLRKALYLPQIKDNALSAEKELWENVSKFIIYGESEKFKGFVYTQSHSN